MVLDDIGSERTLSSDYTRRTLLMLYERRCDRGLRTIWTSICVWIRIRSSDSKTPNAR